MRIWVGLRWSMAALFALSAAVQLNDPDPLAWVAIYLAAMAASLVPDRHRLAVDGRGLVAVAAAAWAGWLGWQLWSMSGAEPGPGLLGMFESMDGDLRIELMREIGGLSIAAVFLGAAALVARRARARP